MDISSVGVNSGVVYENKTAEKKAAEEKVKSTPDSEKKDLGVIVEISKDSEEAAKMSVIVNQRNRGAGLTAHRTISGSSADGMVSFYGVSITKEQSEQLQSVIRDLEAQGFVTATPDEEGSYQAGDEALGASWEPGTYAQLGLKVSQLSYVCREMGLSDEAAEQITAAYGKQAEEKINRVNHLMDSVAKQMEAEKEKLYQMVEEYHGGENPYKKNSPAENTTGKSSVELNKEANADIYNMFASLDTSSKENFQNSFQAALEKFRIYFADDPIETYTGTDRENRQLEELVKRFRSILNA